MQAAQAKPRQGQRKSPLMTPYSGPPPAPLLDITRTQRHTPALTALQASAAVGGSYDDDRATQVCFVFCFTKGQTHVVPMKIVYFTYVTHNDKINSSMLPKFLPRNASLL